MKKADMKNEVMWWYTYYTKALTDGLERNMNNVASEYMSKGLGTLQLAHSLRLLKHNEYEDLKNKIIELRYPV